LSGRDYSRQQLFESIEKDELKPLPLTKFEIKQTAKAKVYSNSHVWFGIDKHYYRTVQNILDKNLENSKDFQDQEQEHIGVNHENVRGKKYYH